MMIYRCVTHLTLRFCILIALGAAIASAQAQAQPQDTPPPAEAAPTAPPNQSAPATSPPTTTNTTTPAPSTGSGLSIEEIDAAVARIEADQEIDAAVKEQAKALYQTAKQRTEQTRTETETAASFQQAIETAPAHIEEINAAILALPQDPAAAVKQQFEGVEEVKKVEDELLRAQGEQSALSTRLAELDGQLRDLENRPAKITTELAEEEKALAELETQAKTFQEAELPAPVREAQGQAFTARRQYRLARINRLKQEQVSLERRLELRRRQRELEAKRLATVEARVKALQALVTTKRQAEAERLRKEAVQAQIEAMRSHPLVQGLAKDNVTLSEAATKLEKQLKRVSQDTAWMESTYTQRKSEYDSTRENLEQIGVSELLAQILQEQRRDLGQPIPPRLSADERRDLMKNKIDYERQLREIDTPAQREAVITELIKEKVDSSVSEDSRERIRQEAGKLLEDKAQLLRRYLDSSQELLKQLKALEVARNKLEQLTEEYKDFLDEHLLWTRSAPPMWQQPLSEYRDVAVQLTKPAEWREVGRSLWQRAGEAIPLILFGFLIFVILEACHRRLTIALDVIAGQVRQVYSDRFLLTCKALAASIVLVLPMSFVVIFIGWQLYIAGQSASPTFTAALGQGLIAGGVIIFPFRLSKHLLGNNGLALVHFRWREAPVKLLRFHLRWLWIVLGVCTLIVVFAEGSGDEITKRTLGRLSTMVAAIALSFFFTRIFRKGGGVVPMLIGSRSGNGDGRLRFFTHWIAVLAPLVIAVFAMRGYVFTAVVLGMGALATLVVIGVAIVEHQLALRWLFVAQRRMAIDRARVKREAALVGKHPDAVGEAPVVLEEPEIDLAKINEHTRQLLTTLAFVIVVFGLWLIWADALPALNSLNDKVRLWSAAVGEDGIVTDWITLADLFIAAVIAIVTWLAAKNIPGVLEISILDKLEFDSGSRYAVTSIASYIIIGIGLSIAVKSIGFSWGSVQWLVAALGVGLGFGLQEIVANFVSGLILLFERPLRVGDIVQVGDVTGTVSRIRIRATTIINWDRHELIVPNKEFITGRMLNWTLSNTVNRVVINIGIAYGSDTVRVQEMILEVCNAHPLIMSDPATLVTFEGYGDNALNFVVRTYLPDFENRLLTIHQLHTNIYQRLNEEGITIAFPQRDIHLDSSKPLEFRMLRGKGEGTGEKSERDQKDQT